jgi:flavorubredoxin
MDGTRIDEIAAKIYRISTRVPPELIPGGFTFNQFLVVDEEPLLFHTGLGKMYPALRAAIEKVMPIAQLRWVSFSHFEADECGALNPILRDAPQARALCGTIGALVSVDDFADRPARALAEGESLSLGEKRVTWHDTPHLPHGWDCGFLSESTTRTLFCGDLFTQGGADHPPLTEDDILSPSESFRRGLDYFSQTARAPQLIEKLAATQPTTLACMHGPSYRGDGAKLLEALGKSLTST